MCGVQANNAFLERQGNFRSGVDLLQAGKVPEREFSINSLLVQIHFITEMIWWTGLAPWEFEFPFPGSSASDQGKVTPVVE